MAESVSEPDLPVPWVATGIGSLPGVDPWEAARTVAGELPHWPYLPELPARGAGADMVGRAMSLLSGVSEEFAVETSAGRWRRAARPGRDLRRAASFFEADCEAAHEHFAGYRGPLTVPLAGPWTLAASIADEWGERSLRDGGYVDDLCQAHAEAAAGLVRRFARLLPQARVVVSVDEPVLAAVHRGELPFSSGYRRHAPVDELRIAAGLRRTRDQVRAAGGTMALHTCAPPVWPVLLDLRPDVLSLDVSLIGAADTEFFGTWLESGAGTVWGVWPSVGPAARDQADRSAGAVARWLQRLGLRPDRLSGSSAISPSCGLAGATGPEARAAMSGTREVARRLSDWDS